MIKYVVGASSPRSLVGGAVLSAMILGVGWQEAAASAEASPGSTADIQNCQKPCQVTEQACLHTCFDGKPNAPRACGQGCEDRRKACNQACIDQYGPVGP